MASIRKEKSKFKKSLKKRLGKKMFKNLYGKTIFFTTYTVEVIFDRCYTKLN